jgi:hypothetical protein
MDVRLLCRCTLACSERATQEDGYCDLCRAAQGANIVGHAHIGEVGGQPGDRKRPIDGGMGTMTFTDVRFP